MKAKAVLREDRMYPQEQADQRSAFQRDRDRLLYSPELRRLAEVTQVVGSTEGGKYHNRLIHTLKVAQIGRRLAQHLGTTKLALELGGIDPEVVETACLAHDLGHPPFGHIGENEISRLLQEHGVVDRYEGNAQSLRIVTRLSAKRNWLFGAPVSVAKTKQSPSSFVFAENGEAPPSFGLNLTRASLLAILKYPWLREDKGKKARKWGAYNDDSPALEFALAGLPGGYARGVEAELMDWADDLTYAVHDFEDFWKAGLIPWALIQTQDSEREAFLKSCLNSWTDSPEEGSKRLESALDRILGFAGPEMSERYDGSYAQRAALLHFSSQLIKRYFKAIALHKPTKKKPATVSISKDDEDEVRVLKHLTWHYVINSHVLAAQQHGHRKILRELFEILFESINNWTGPGSPTIVPLRHSHLLGKGINHARLAADCLADMTENEALGLYARVSGLEMGSIRDPIVW